MEQLRLQDSDVYANHIALNINNILQYLYFLATKLISFYIKMLWIYYKHENGQNMSTKLAGSLETKYGFKD